MAIPILGLLSQPAAQGGNASQKAGVHTPDFENLLNGLAARPAATQPRDDASDTSAGPPSETADQQLQQALQSLTNGHVDLHAPGLGLTEQQREDLAKKLDQLAKELDQDAAQLLASLLGGGNAAANLDANPLAALLGTNGQGAADLSAVSANLRLLAQAIQLMNSSEGHLTLAEAVGQLAPKGDAFAEQLAAALAPADDGSNPDTGPPEGGGSGQGPGQAASGAAPSTAGSNGHELTDRPQRSSPADGAGQEEAQQGQPVVSMLAQALEELIQAEKTKSQDATEAGGQAAGATAAGQSGQAVAAGTNPPAPGTPAAHSPSSPTQGAPGGGVQGPAAGQAAGTQASAAAPAQQPAVAPAGPSFEAALVAAAPDGKQASSGESDSGSAGGNGHQAGSSQQQAGQASTDRTALAVTLNPGVAPSPAADAPAASAPAVPARPSLEQSIVEQIVQRATVAISNGQQEFRIQLQPEFLGSMEVRVSISDGNALVRMSVDNASTRQLIDANISQLRQAFGTTNLRVQHVANFSGSDASWLSFNSTAHQGSWQGHNPYDPGAHLPEAIAFSGEPEPDQAAPAVQPAAAGVAEPVTSQHPVLSSTGVDIQA